MTLRISARMLHAALQAGCPEDGWIDACDVGNELVACQIDGEFDLEAAAMRLNAMIANSVPAEDAA
jgi:hypothetical protein